MKIDFILYKPAVPGNIGAAARAIKTMGFNSLCLIDPCDHKSEEALMMAHGSHDVLLNARVYPDFESAVNELDFLIGTTAKKRSSHEDYHSPAEALQQLKMKGKSVSNAGVLFGTEESGLPNELLQQCDIASSIPLKTPYPSLNLAQAVMLYAYEFSALELVREKLSETEAVSFSELKKRTALILKEIGIPNEMPLHNRIMERMSLLGEKDINLLHSITSRLLERF